MKSLLIAFFAFAPALAANFPTGPDSRLTTGSLCSQPDAYRYAEKIPYCNRNVDDGMKAGVIREYDQQLGYHIQQMNRQDFKIDHFFPLCAGGSNNSNNLWPQHKSVYSVTDPLEQIVCVKMEAGRLKQADAIQILIRGKLHLDEVPELFAKVKAL